MYLRYLSCIKKFGLPPSASCPVNRNVNDEECLPLVSVSKGCVSVFQVQSHVHINKILEKSLPHNQDFPFSVRHEFKTL